MSPRCEPPDALLDATRRALAACSDGLDLAAVQPETPLVALLFDSLMALNFIASLEAVLGVADLPFERWLAEHSESADAVTIGSLIAWLGSLPEIAARDGASVSTERAAGLRRGTSGGPPEGR